MKEGPRGKASERKAVWPLTASVEGGERTKIHTRLAMLWLGYLASSHPATYLTYQLPAKPPEMIRLRGRLEMATIDVENSAAQANGTEVPFYR